MTDLEWKLFVQNLNVGHKHETNGDYLHEMVSRVYLTFPDSQIIESVVECNGRIVHAVNVVCDGRELGFHVELPLTGVWKGKA